ncbi:dihydropteroate synthase [Acetonema longum]|uniref:Methyltetrahydrofolate:corrinoid/iron-sulfur protein methyltransferase n=1 Tax=Acetonema longum DSM 6540 TaxID=1009370 RepID=F7NE87_9FIRM|nr:dihydropteroate synthase [Acetonema longum]EGO65599.1 methyltetrahydrofolate:corrinoid/iron-sulfur protein methyltransferase [Acetonema longum DSM 6540]
MAMIIIGEKINSTKKSIAQAVKARDSAYIQEEALKQQKGGATLLDANCGTLDAADEPEAMEWLVQTIQAVTDLPLCIDSPNPAALARGLAVHKGKPLINSISGESERFKQVLSLVKQYQASVVALCMDDRGIPCDYETAREVGVKLINTLLQQGIAVEDIYFDPLLRAVGTDTAAAVDCFRLIENISTVFPGIHITCGLSNVSHGLPERKHLNRAFLVLAMEHGLDAPIIDPTDPTAMALVYAANTILNRDKRCIQYTKAYRAGKLTF